MLESLKTHLCVEREIAYTGSELAPHWIYREFDLMGHAVVGFIGPADVPLAHMVDLEDVKQKAPIASNRMLHFLGEFFIDSFEEAILLQHYFMLLIFDELRARSIEKLSRRGNDLYFEGRKLSVSIACKSATSCLLHAAINITSEGTPIPTANLSELHIDPLELGASVLNRLTEDVAIMAKARVKVAPR